MHLLKPAAILLALPILLGSSLKNSAKNTSGTTAVAPGASPKIQAAILLDVSNSMDGLIAQAKAQLWNMVTVMAKAKCNDATPQIEIALYEYGSPRNDVQQGYVKQRSPFTTDLDQLSKNLFALTTNGGDEYCGQVIYNSVDELAWDTSAQSYKVIFIAGNEEFFQGKITFTQACALAKQKGIIVNTIYCGDSLQGIREHWHLGAECGSGSFTNINQDAKIEDIPTPYDSSILVLNKRLNSTYIGYGANGLLNSAKQEEVDKMNFTVSSTAALKRTATKAYVSAYNNAHWDMADASTADSTFIAKVDLKTLPDSLQNKSREEIGKIVKAKTKERSDIQKQILTLNAQRQKFIVEERQKNNATRNVQTLETATEKIIRQQASKFNMTIAQ
jgi:hypothetical protein